MNKRIINTSQAPAPIGPYNQAVEMNGLVFISGQIPIDPQLNTLVDGSVVLEAEQVMKNLQAILLEAGLSFEHVIKTSIFLTDMNDFGQVNDVYASYFSSNYPARETVQVSRLPRDVRVEISMIAGRPQ